MAIEKDMGSFLEAFKEANDEFEKYLSTFGRFKMNFDGDTINDNGVPQNALIEITVGDRVSRASVSVEKLLAKLLEMKSAMDEGNYPRWLDERPAHMTTEGTLLRVDEVRYNPEKGMFAFVSVFDIEMDNLGTRVVEITGKTDRKALARKVAGEGADEAEARRGYVIWRRVA